MRRRCRGPQHAHIKTLGRVVRRRRAREWRASSSTIRGGVASLLASVSAKARPAARGQTIANPDHLRVADARRGNVSSGRPHRHRDPAATVSGPARAGVRHCGPLRPGRSRDRRPMPPRTAVGAPARPAASMRRDGEGDALRRNVGAVGPAVIDDDERRRMAGVGRRRRIPQRSRHRENRERREHEPQGQQPPRRARGRLVLRAQRQQNADRRKRNALRARRRDPDQHPDHRQRDQTDERQRRGEGERQGQRMPSISAPLRSSAASRLMRSASSASEAGRSVRCRPTVNPLACAISAMRSRCSREPREIFGAIGFRPARAKPLGAKRRREIRHGR